SLIAADAGFVGYEYLSAIHQSGRSLLIRVGSNVRLLKKLGYFKESGNTVYLWPRSRGVEEAAAAGSAAGRSEQRQTSGVSRDQCSVAKTADQCPSDYDLFQKMGNRGSLSAFQADVSEAQVAQPQQRKCAGRTGMSRLRCRFSRGGQRRQVPLGVSMTMMGYFRRCHGRS